MAHNMTLDCNWQHL